MPADAVLRVNAVLAAALICGCSSGAQKPPPNLSPGSAQGQETAREPLSPVRLEPASGEVLLSASFDQHQPGAYRQHMVASDFGATPAWNDGLDEGRASIVLDGDNPVLRVTYTGGKYGPSEGGVQFMVPFSDNHEQLYLSYRIRFASGFDFVRGGKLPGLVGGSAPTGCVEDITGFSARGMWRTGGTAVQYMYFPEKQSDCGDDFGYAVGDVPVRFTPGVWHEVMHRIWMNMPGERNGILQAWFDGQQVLDERGLVYRTADAGYAVDALYFSTFFGGGDASWAPATDQIADYDDFVVSTGPVAG